MSKLNKVGSQYKGFVVTKYLPINEIKCTLVECTHEATGAKIMHLKNTDIENLFSILFQTIPDSSNGAAHILEHIVLCGSKKYPLKDPFFSMTRRSLNTFMNAMTGSDFTCYPASSQVEVDFYNLLEVYLDAVFNPLLKKESFLQEGHRLEFEIESDIKSPLKIKGVVYNEMKGAMSSIDSRLWQSLFANLTPDLPYSHNSGGDPLIIPFLTHQELIQFHKKFYNPSNALFFFYGNIDTQKHLDFIDKMILKDAKKHPIAYVLKEQARFNEPKIVNTLYPISKEEKEKAKNIISFSWLTIKTSDQENILTLSLIEQLLMGTDVSYLKKSLLNSNLITQASSYLDLEMSEIPWIIICRGVDSSSVIKLQDLLFSRLQEIAQETIPQDSIKAAIHQLEFSRTEITEDSYPYGLSLFFRSALAQKYGAFPENSLMIHSLFETLRQKTKDPKYLSRFIEKYFLQNTHFLTLNMHPSENLLNEELQIESNNIKVIEKKLTLKEKNEIVQQTKNLKKYQAKLESKSLNYLPKIEIKDIPKKIKDFELIHKKNKNIDIFFHDVFTNQIVYLDLFFDLPNINQEDLCYISLFTSFLTELGCDKLTYSEALEYQEAYTGGISSSVSLHIQSEDYNKLTPSFSIRGKALYRNTEKLFEILKTYLKDPKINDVKRIKQLVLQLNSSLENRLTKNAMQYAITSSLEGLSTGSSIYEKWHGTTFYKFVRKIAYNLEKEIPLLIEKFHLLKESLLSLNQMHLVIGCDKDHFELIEKNNFYNLNTLKKNKIIPWSGEYTFKQVKSHAYTLPISVAFSALAYQTTGFTDPLSPYLLLAAEIMENTILHTKIREVGGAYGAGANYSPTSGQFYFYGYRDPNIKSTIEAFHEAIEMIAKGKFSTNDLEEAKRGVIQSIDDPISPGSRAYTAYIWRRTKKTYEMRQIYRDKILKATKSDIAKAIEKNLLKQKTKGKFVSFCSEALFNKELGENFLKLKI
jgi:presequence protease